MDEKKELMMFILKMVAFEMYESCHFEDDEGEPELNEQEWDEWKERMKDLIAEENFIYEMENAEDEYDLILKKLY